MSSGAPRTACRGSVCRPRLWRISAGGIPALCSTGIRQALADLGCATIRRRLRNGGSSRSACFAVTASTAFAPGPGVLLGQVAAPHRAGRAGIPAGLQGGASGGGAGCAGTCRRRHGLARGAALLVTQRAATVDRLGVGSPDKHLVRIAFELHTVYGSGRGEIDQQGRDGSPVPPKGERR
jgi:hypothetical protein